MIHAAEKRAQFEKALNDYIKYSADVSEDFSDALDNVVNVINDVLFEVGGETCALVYRHNVQRALERILASGDRH
jgi:hypothetical protein